MDYLTALGSRYPYGQKFYLEELLHRSPSNLGLMDAYFTGLLALSRSGFGVMHASLPGYDPPIFFRGMTTDIFNMQQIFRHKEYGFEFASPPGRILDLGAYGGYAAIFLANRFPNAEIVCVEPSRTNFRLLCMNTLPYENIRRVHGAVWHEPARLSLVDRIGGDWGSIFGEQHGTQSEGVQAYTVPGLLNLVGWPSADYVKCDIEGAELEIFADPAAADWLSDVSCVSVETHDRFKPGCTEAVEAALPPTRFERQRSGEFHVFTRVAGQAKSIADKASGPELILLTPQTLRLRRFDRVNVPPEAWGFCIVDDETFQLHPKPPGEGQAEIRFHLNLSGQRQFSSRCQLTDKSEWPVAFSVRLVGDGRSAFDESTMVAPGQVLDWELDIPQREGPYELILGTEMVPPATTNGFAWAQWTRPALR